MKEFSADKAYSSKTIYRILESIRVTPYIPFKRNSKKESKDAPDLWNKMLRFFKDNREEFEQHYHQRSNVETVFCMIKRRLGEYLLSKNYVAQRNELLMKMICHNICCLIEESFELGIEIDFRKLALLYVERKVSDEFKTRDASNPEISAN